jgi:cytidyltransferase-like protein
MSKTVITAGPYDEVKGRQVRYLYEVAKYGEVTLLLFSDELIKECTGSDPKFPYAERHYYVASLRHVSKVVAVDNVSQLDDFAALVGKKVDMCCAMEACVCDSAQKRCDDQGVELNLISDVELKGYPEIPADETKNSGVKAIVTGCFDWFHTGHVRFLEEASEHGDLYACIGNDKNIELLKGSGRPIFKQDERRFICSSIKFVKQCLVTTGSGYLDAKPEIERIKPDKYVVNEDGSKDEKAEYCKHKGSEYVVLKREPKQGLTRRSSTDLRKGK